MGKIKLYPSGATNYISVSKRLTDNPSDYDEKLLDSNIALDENSIFRMSFEFPAKQHAVYDGADFNINYDNLNKFMILRRDVEDDTWRYMGTTSSNCKYYQDFTAASSRKYEYRVIPLLLNDGNLQVQSIMSTKIDIPVADYISIIGLKETDDESVYEIDYDNVWILLGAAVFDDTTYVSGKVFSDTLGRFPKETVNRKRYIRGGGSGFIGDFLCNSYMYSESFNVSKAWEDFCYSSNLKLIKDLRGNVIPCDIDSFSTSTEALGDQIATSTKFTFTQLKDFDDITVLPDETKTYLQKHPVIADAQGRAIRSSDNLLIAADRR